MAQNDEREGVFDDVISLIDSMDNTMSAKIDDVDYFRAAILYIAGSCGAHTRAKRNYSKVAYLPNPRYCHDD
ncbi:phage portal protein [Levilactobacillus brevis]|uniref:phage portal protein n=1 Tax=Levilactobacillus brevis TaxID=1580 RepID=UPI0038572FD4